MKMNINQYLLRGVSASAMLGLAVGLCLLGGGCQANGGKSQSQNTISPQEAAILAENDAFSQGAKQPPRPQTLFSLARILTAQGRDPEAASVLQALLQRYPDYMPAYNALAEVCLRAGRPADATIALSTGLKRRPNDPILLNNLGMVHFLQEQYPQALEQFDLALEARPDAASFRANKAMTLAMLGRSDEAANLYNGIVERNEARHNLRILNAARASLTMENQPAQQAPAPEVSVTLNAEPIETTIETPAIEAPLVLDEAPATDSSIALDAQPAEAPAANASSVVMDDVQVDAPDADEAITLIEERIETPASDDPLALDDEQVIDASLPLEVEQSDAPAPEMIGFDHEHADAPAETVVIVPNDDHAEVPAEDISIVLEDEQVEIPAEDVSIVIQIGPSDGMAEDLSLQADRDQAEEPDYDQFSLNVVEIEDYAPDFWLALDARRAETPATESLSLNVEPIDEPAPDASPWNDLEQYEIPADHASITPDDQQTNSPAASASPEAAPEPHDAGMLGNDDRDPVIAG